MAPRVPSNGRKLKPELKASACSNTLKRKGRQLNNGRGASQAGGRGALQDKETLDLGLERRAEIFSKSKGGKQLQ